jgi:hypothetical protein
MTATFSNPSPSLDLTPETRTENRLPAGPGDENPVWTGLDVLLIAILLLASIFFFSALFIGVAVAIRSYHHTDAGDILKNPSAMLVVPPMILSYLLVGLFLYLLVTRVRKQSFWQAVAWRWPEGGRWFLYLCGGGILALVVGFVSRYLPIPKSLPIDLMFRERASAFLLAGFGIFVAPLVEEMLFRGFLYPVLVRWLRDSLGEAGRLRHGAIVILVSVLWGFISHRIPGPWNVLLLVLPFVVIPIVLVLRAVRSVPVRAARLILPGIVFCAWGFVGLLRGRPFSIATLCALGLALILATLGALRPLPPSSARRWAIAIAVLLTAAAFALVHSQQLGESWAALLMLFIASLVFTVTRAVTRSVTPGFLIHFGYNATLFTLMFFATDHFRHMERLSR